MTYKYFFLETEVGGGGEGGMLVFVDGSQTEMRRCPLASLFIIMSYYFE